jgi:hypothetical protein
MFDPWQPIVNFWPAGSAVQTGKKITLAVMTREFAGLLADVVQRKFLIRQKRETRHGGRVGP